MVLDVESLRPALEDVLFAGLFAGPVLIVLLWTIPFIITTVKGNAAGRGIKILTLCLSTLTVCLVIYSFLFNLGWIRVFMLWILLLPMVMHGTYFFAIQNLAAFHMHRIKALRIISPFSYVCYIGTYLCIPDVGDIGGSYAVFGMVKDDAAEALGYLVPVFLIGSLTCLIALTIFVVRGFRQAKREENRAVTE